jgi:acyl-coenzyme A thioesterase PaaI-like protein
LNNKTLDIWKRFESIPAGKWMFSRIVCLKAPYFSSISPRFIDLRPGHCEIQLRKRRAVLNHIGTVHAIAMCNMAELAAGTMTEVTIPSSHRWIPKGMVVKYLQKAETDLRAIAIPASELNLSEAGEYLVNVQVLDKQDHVVFTASISMWVAPKKKETIKTQ